MLNLKTTLFFYYLKFNLVKELSELINFLLISKIGFLVLFVHFKNERQFEVVSRDVSKALQLFVVVIDFQRAVSFKSTTGR